MGVGVLFVLLAVLAMVWSKVEQRAYDEALIQRKDLREYMSHWPLRPEASALKTGGWIALAIGVILLIISGYFWFTG